MRSGLSSKAVDVVPTMATRTLTLSVSVGNKGIEVWALTVDTEVSTVNSLSSEPIQL